MINVCFECGSKDLRRTRKSQKFEYNDGGRAVKLNADVEVLRCSTCGFQMTDEQAETARQEAVCAYHGVMSPSKVKAIREATGMSRSEFAKLTRIGDASLIRWETGSHVPNAGYDNFLYLLGFRDNVERLKQRTPGQSPLEQASFENNQVIAIGEFKGKVIASNDAAARYRSEQKVFLLRRTG